MKFGNLMLRKNHILFAFFLLIIGTALICSGLIGAFIDIAYQNQKITDAEIIKRAKELGYVEMKEYYKPNL